MRVHLRHSRARKLSCAVSRNKTARAAARHSKQSCVPGPRGGAPLLQPWLHTPSCSDLVWIPASGFGSVSVSMTTKSCLSHACYLAATSGFIMVPHPMVSTCHDLWDPISIWPTPHLVSSSIQSFFASALLMPHSEPCFWLRVQTTHWPIPTWVCWTHFLYEMMEIQSFPSGCRRRKVQPLKAQALTSDLNSNLNCVTVSKLPNLFKRQFPNLFKDDKYT